MRVFVLLEFVNIELFTFDINLTIYLLYIYFSLAISFKFGSIKILVFVVGLTICLAHVCFNLVINIVFNFLGNIDL